MLIVSSTVGSLTSTGWNRRSSAASFSMCFRYSSSVVAPMRVQLAARQHRLEHVGRVHRALGGAGADHGVELVDEQDDLALRVGDLLQDRLQPLFELAAVLRPGDERAHVEGDDAFVLQAFRHVAADDAAGQPFDDRGLADAGLADEDRIVLRPAREHLDHAADFLVAANHRIELAAAGQLGEVAAVALERLISAFRVLVRHALRAAHARQRREDLVAGEAALASAVCAAGERPVSDAMAMNRCSVLTYSSFSRSASACAEIGDDLEPRRQARLRAAVGLRHFRRAARARARAICAGSAAILRRTSGTIPSRCSTSATSRCSGSICAWLICSASCCAASDRFLGFFRVFVDIHVVTLQLGIR